MLRINQPSSSFQVSRRFALSAALIVALPLCASGQMPNYYWDSAQGGLVDSQTGLVWGFRLYWVTGGNSTYAHAMATAPSRYASSPWAYGFADWRNPSKAELADAAAKGVWDDLVLSAVAVGLITPEQGAYEINEAVRREVWASDKSFKQKGQTYAYVVNLISGGIRTLNVASYMDAIVVRKAW